MLAVRKHCWARKGAMLKGSCASGWRYLIIQSYKSHGTKQHSISSRTPATHREGQVGVLGQTSLAIGVVGDTAAWVHSTRGTAQTTKKKQKSASF